MRKSSQLRQVPDELIALDEALSQLAATDPKAAELVNLRYFAGLSVQQAAEVLGISPRTADFLWAFARAWLLRQIEGEEPGCLANRPGSRGQRKSEIPLRDFFPEYALQDREALGDPMSGTSAISSSQRYRKRLRPTAGPTWMKSARVTMNLRRGVEALLEVHDRAGGFLESPVSGSSVCRR